MDGQHIHRMVGQRNERRELIVLLKRVEVGRGVTRLGVWCNKEREEEQHEIRVTDVLFLSLRLLFKEWRVTKEEGHDK